MKIFYKQRVFEYLLRQNINFTSTMRQNYLIALVHLLEQMPEELLFLHLTEVSFYGGLMIKYYLAIQIF